MRSRTCPSSCLVLVTLAIPFLASSTFAECVDYMTFPTIASMLDVNVGAIAAYDATHLVGVDGLDLVVIDVADPGSPTVASRIQVATTFADLAVCAPFVYWLTVGGDVRVIDTTTPGSPTVLGTMAHAAPIAAIGGAGDLLAIVDSDTTWTMCAVVDPLAPTCLQRTTCDFTVRDVAISPQLAVAVGIGWQAYDLADPANPAPLGGEVYWHDDDPTYGYGWDALASAGQDRELLLVTDHWYVVSGEYETIRHELALHHLDLTLAGAPRTVATVILGSFDGWTNPPAIAVDGRHVFIQHGAITIRDLDADLALLARIPGAGVENAFAVAEPHVYAAGSGRLATYRLPEPLVDNTLAIGPALPDDDYHLGSVTSGAGWYAASAIRVDNEGPIGSLAIYDVAHSSGSLVRAFSARWAIFGNLEAMEQALLFSVDGELDWLDMTDPMHPGTVAQYVPITGVTALAAGPGTLVAMYSQTWSAEKLRIYDLANPSLPSLVGTAAIPGASDLLWCGDLLLVASDSGNEIGELHVVDMHDATHPTFLTTLALPHVTWVQPAGEQRVLVGDDDMLALIDLADPAAPVIVATTDVVTDVAAAAVGDDVVYVANGGLWALSLPEFTPLGVLAPGCDLVRLLKPTPDLWAVATNATAAFPVPSHCAIATGAGEPEGDIPTARTVALTAAPNPFNPRVTLSFALPAAGHATLVVFDLAGRRVARLADGPFAAGPHAIIWEAGGLASGVYLAQLRTAWGTTTTRVMLVR